MILEKLAEFYFVIFHLGWKKGYGLGLKEYGTDVTIYFVILLFSS